MSKVIDVRSGGGEVVILGKALVLPSSSTDGADLPLDGSLRFNPESSVVEVYTDNSWAPLGDNGGGGHTHTISQVTGLLDALSSKSDTVHVHPFSEVSGLQAALNAKSAIGHIHAIADVLNLQTALDSLQTALSAKASTAHTHVIGDVTGLQTALDGKASVSHAHGISNITGLEASLNLSLKATIEFCISGTPVDFFKYVYISSRNIKIPQNFVGSFVHAYIPPLVPLTIKVFHEEVEVGAIHVNEATGQSTFTTISSQGINLPVGERLIFKFPDTADARISDIAFSIIGLLI